MYILYLFDQIDEEVYYGQLNLMSRLLGYFRQIAADEENPSIKQILNINTWRVNQLQTMLCCFLKHIWNNFIYNKNVMHFKL